MCFTWTYNSYLTHVISHRTGKNHVNLMHWSYLPPQVTLVFTADYVKNDVILCKFDFNVKN